MIGEAGLRDFTQHGFVIIPDAVPAADLDCAAAAFVTSSSNRQFAIPPALVGWLAAHEGLTALAHRLSGGLAHLVRILALDKSAAANWFVPWHQDRAIAVEPVCDAQGFENWTFKDGCHHAEPPVWLLDQMVTLRIHLDDCGPENGPLEVMPETHCAGRLDRSAIDHITATRAGRVCQVRRGGILAMRPLLLHRSQKAQTTAHRRVLHLEYCAATLPVPMQWAICPAAAEH